MDNNDRRRRQSNTSAFPAQANPYSTTPYTQSSAPERYRQPTLSAQSPTTVPSSGRGAGAAAAAGSSGYGYGYSGEGTQFVGQSMQAGASTLAYPAAAYSHEQQRTSQQFQQYGAATGMMYNVSPTQTSQQQQQHPAQQSQAQSQSQQQAQQSPQSPYESVQPYQQQESAALGVLSSQFRVPQQYFVAGEGGPTSAPSAAAMAPQNVTASYSGLQYTSQQSPVQRGALGAAFNPGMSDAVAAAAAAQGAFGQDAFGPVQTQQQQQQQQQQQDQSAAELDQAYARYQTVLKRTFEYVRDGRLGEAGRSLLEMSDWLVNNAENLGLVRDDQALHSDRLKLWDDFNTCWLTTLQKQKEMSEEFVSTGQDLRPPENLLEYDFMESLGRELIRLCDILEKHGLVDYQMGIWEEEIVSMLTSCLDILEDQPRATSSTGAQQPSSSSNARRR